MTLALELPPEMAGATVAAHLDRGRRSISWTLTTPGQVHRNTYRWAWIDVTEQKPWKGDPLWLSASRRVDEGYHRQPFTDAARTALHRRIVPQLARRFGDEWDRLHRAAVKPSTVAVEHARRTLAWAEQAVELNEMYRAGHLTFRPVQETSIGRAPSIAVPDRHRFHVEAAAAAYHDGEHVGWMSRSGELLPLDDLLRTVPR